MRVMPQRWRGSALGLVVLVGLSGCVASGGGYVEGVYVTSGDDYDGWGRGYRVAPPRRGIRRPARPIPHVYRPAPPTRQAPSIPTRPHGRR